MDREFPTPVDDGFGQDHRHYRRLTLDRGVRRVTAHSSKAISLTVPRREQQPCDYSHEPLDRIGVVNRRLVAVAFADVAGFCKLMELDDVGTLRKWKTLLDDLIEPRIREHRGNLMRVIGDGLLVEFHSAVDAVQWALDVQQAMSEANDRADMDGLVMRIGINVEDAIVDANDVHGTGVNIAARIQQLARPGEVLMTAAVHHYVWNKLPAEFCDLGERNLKNICQPIRVYRLMRKMPVQVFPEWAKPQLDCGRQRSTAAIFGVLFGITAAWAFSQSAAIADFFVPMADQRPVNSTRLRSMTDEQGQGPVLDVSHQTASD